nr:Ni/Fe-hydrogenase 2 B-type cytochrome subunit [uncultured bacterium]
MALEFAPALFERLGWKVSLQRLNKGDVLHHRARCAAADHAPVFNGVADDLGGLQGASVVAEL